MKRDLLLWTSILTAPLVWLASFGANFALAPLACGGGGKFAQTVIFIAALIIAAGSCLLGLTLRRKEPSLEERPQFMAVVGACMSAGFFLVIAAQGIPQLLFSGCE